MLDGFGLSWATALAALALGYLSGSVPYGLLLTRLAGTADSRAIGSGNIGATNVLRTGRKDLAIATLLLDALKGSVAVWIALRWGVPAAALAGLGAFLGHLFPVWLKFRGGKGVATYIGVVLALYWPWLLIFARVWLSVAVLTRYSSAGALAASLATALAAVFSATASVKGFELLPFAALIVAMTVLLWWKHGENIARLRAGTEGKIGQKG